MAKKKAEMKTTVRIQGMVITGNGPEAVKMGCTLMGAFLGQLGEAIDSGTELPTTVEALPPVKPKKIRKQP